MQVLLSLVLIVTQALKTQAHRLPAAATQRLTNDRSHLNHFEFQIIVFVRMIQGKFVHDSDLEGAGSCPSAVHVIHAIDFLMRKTFVVVFVCSMRPILVRTQSSDLDTSHLSSSNSVIVEEKICSRLVNIESP